MYISFKFSFTIFKVKTFAAPILRQIFHGKMEFKMPYSRDNLALLPAVAKGKYSKAKTVIHWSEKASEMLFRAASPKTCQTNLLAR